MVILLLIAAVVFSLTSATGKLWKSSTEKMDAFQKSRSAFELMTRQISQATLNTYWDYFDASGNIVSGNTPINRYDRNSELHFITGNSASLLTGAQTWSGETSPVRPTHCVFFTAPLGNIPAPAVPPATNPPDLHGLNMLLNATGYYIEFNSDLWDRPKFLQTNTTSARHRYRLMQLSQTTDKLRIYDPDFAASKGSPAYNYWFDNAVTTTTNVRPIAENIVALVVLPQRSPADGGTLSPDYSYDSRNRDSINNPRTARNLQRNQLPPMVQVTMVALDETSAIQLALRNGKNAPPLVPISSFTDPTKYSSGDPENPGDLENLKISLAEMHLTYRVFTTNIVIRGAKWSEN
jgi:uncharacterized protein (TIGR02599 family)